MGDDQLDRLDYYTLLGVARDAGVADVKRAFRQFGRKYHPDRFAGQDEAKSERATRIYRRGSEAFGVLTDPISRAAYDANLKKGILRLSSEERDRAMARQMASDAAGGVPIASPAALALYKRAGVAARERRWLDCWELLKDALAREPGNELILTRVDQVKRMIESEPFEVDPG